MNELRTTVRLNKRTLEILDEVIKKWPETEGNRSEQIRRALADWDHIRENGSVTTRTQIAERLACIEKQLNFFTSEIRPKRGLAHLEDELAEMKQMLRQLVGGNNAPHY